jgi:hypothetical protein
MFVPAGGLYSLTRLGAAVLGQTTNNSLHAVDVFVGSSIYMTLETRYEDVHEYTNGRQHRPG